MRFPGLRYLRTFQVAARHESFKTAAQELFVTPSAISHQIKSLEENLGIPLFHRSSHSLSLTAAGKSYFEKIDVILSQLETTTDELVASYGRPIVQIQMPPFFSSELFLPRLQAFDDGFPSLDLRIETVKGADTVHPPGMDLSIALGTGPWPDFEYEPLFRQRYVIACGESFLTKHSITHPKDLDGKPFVVLERDLKNWKHVLSQFGVTKVKPSKLIRMDSMPHIARATEQGLGVALLSWPAGAAWLRSPKLVQLFPEVVTSSESFFLLHRKQDLARQEVKQLRQWILQEFQEFD